MDSRLLESAKKGKKRSGQKDLINYLQGKRLTQRQAIRGKCYDCQGMGEASECDSEECVLFPYSPYKISTDPTFKGNGDVENDKRPPEPGVER